MKIGYLILCSLIAIMFLMQTTKAQKEFPADFCISQEEFRLFNLVNDYRKSQNLPAIPLSKSLSFVAKVHIDDLITNKPDTANCSFHSWSGLGTWKPCCFRKENKDKYCILTKPKELTNYPGLGHEIVFWESRDATAEKAIKQWKETSVSRFMLTNFKDWEKCTWNAIGVGVKGGFAILWLGEEPDVEKEIKICGGETIVAFQQPVVHKPLSVETPIVSSATGRFYLIYGNMNSLKEARTTAEKYKQEGFSKVKIVAKDNKYRISLSDYATKETAAQGKKELPAKYKDAWILPF